MPPPSQGILGPMVKTFLFAAALPITLPIFLYKLAKGDFKRMNSDPFQGFGGFNGFNGFGGFQDGFNSGYSDTRNSRDSYSYVDQQLMIITI